MEEILRQFDPITLDEMSGIRLMNRIDTKFVTTMPVLTRLLAMAQGEYLAQEIDGERNMLYHTTYFDTSDYDMFYTHQHGHANRQKLRFRTYVASDLQFLEVKTKNNHGRTKKKRIQVPGQEVTEVREKADEFLEGLVHKHLDDIHPTVQNHFHRITLVNYGKTERLTIDFDVEFRNFETDSKKETGQLVIIELKRDGNVYSPILDMLRVLRIKPSGFSKYCIGSVMTNRGLKHNMFKQKMVRIRKLVGENIFD